MKKIILVLVMMFTFSLMACDNNTVTTVAPSTTYDYSQDINDLENDIDSQIASLELQIALLEERLDNMIAVQGINGNTVYYEKKLSLMKTSLSDMLDSFKEELAPTYMTDEDGDYVTFNTIAGLLKEKYLGVTYTTVTGIGSDSYVTIPYARLNYVFEDATIDINDVVARMILMVEELTHYEYYVLSSNGIQLQMVWSDGAYSHKVSIEIPTTVLINDMFTIDFDSIRGHMFEIKIQAEWEQDTIDYEAAKVFYDAYVKDGTYAGYVLDFTDTVETAE